MFIKNCPGEIHDTVHLIWGASYSQSKCVLKGKETEALTLISHLLPTSSTEYIQFEMDKFVLSDRLIYNSL